MTPHSTDTESVLEELSTSQKEGLSAQAAAERLSEYGPNRLQEKKKRSLPQRFFDQFKDVMILILIAAAAVSFAVAIAEGESGEFFEPILILLIVVLNAVMGVLQ